MAALSRVVRRTVSSLRLILAGMSSHLERTEHVPREDIITTATVVDMWEESKTVKGLSLYIEEKDFHFKPGQWVDVFISGVSVVGGFSITSTPKQLKDCSIIKLAVKKSEHPPAAWIHNECHTGSKVSVRCGGDFFYDGSRRCDDLLLIAGGVGITPVASIIQHAIELREESDKKQTRPAVNQIVLLYSAVEKGEFLFENRFRSLSASHPFFQVNFYITGKKYNGCVPEGFYCGRIQSSLLHQTVQSLDRSHLLCFVCGPPPMAESMFAALKDSRVEESRILYEKWW